MDNPNGSAPRARRLPLTIQVGFVLGLALVLYLGLVVLPGVFRAGGAGAAGVGAAGVGEAAPAGTFRATAEQWGALGFADVGEAAFADAVASPGRIALDDDVSVQVTSPFSGRVVSVAVVAGQRVARGQALLSAQASEVAQARSDLAAAQATLQTARAQAALAAANAGRQQALYAISGAALRDVQQASNDSEAAQQAVRSDTAALALVRARLGLLQAGPGDGPQQGGLAVVRAPVSGVVVSRAVGPGQFLNATANGATTPIFVVSDLSKVWLSAEVDEADAARMRVGEPITVRVLALPGRLFHARLDYVAAGIDPATRRLTVHAVVANPDGQLKPEMFADFTLDAGPAQTSPAVPASAVIYEGSTARVWVAGPGRTLGLRPIAAGRTQEGQVQALSGLRPGERVVTSGALFIDRAAKAG